MKLPAARHRLAIALATTIAVIACDAHCESAQGPAQTATQGVTPPTREVKAPQPKAQGRPIDATKQAGAQL